MIRFAIVMTVVLLEVCVTAPIPARADAAGETLLLKCVAAEGRLHALQADFTEQIRAASGVHSAHGTLKLKKPNLIHIEQAGAHDEDNLVTNSDGKQCVQSRRDIREYVQQPADLSGGNVGRTTGLVAAMAFFNPDVLNQIRAQETGVKIQGGEVIDGMECRALKFVGGDQGVRTLYIGLDGLLRGESVVTGSEEARVVLEIRLVHLRVNGVLTPSGFLWAPPKGARVVPSFPPVQHVAPNPNDAAVPGPASASFCGWFEPEVERGTA